MTQQVRIHMLALPPPSQRRRQRRYCPRRRPGELLPLPPPLPQRLRPSSLCRWLAQPPPPRQQAGL